MGIYLTKDFIKALEKKGFKRDKSHHNMFWFYFSGKKTSIRTRTSHNEKEFDESMLNERKKQMKLLDRKQFIDFYKCPLDGEVYAKFLIDNEYIKINYIN